MTEAQFNEINVDQKFKQGDMFPGIGGEEIVWKCKAIAKNVRRFRCSWIGVYLATYDISFVNGNMQYTELKL
jgi:hypothetical protein